MKFKVMSKIAAMIFLMGFAVVTKAQTAADAVDALKEGVAKSQSKDYLGAIESFKKCISIYDKLGEPENENKATAIGQIPNMQYKYALGLYKKKMYSESIEAFKKLAEYSKTYNDPKMLKKANGVIPQLYYFKGKDLLDAKDYDAALDALNKSIELNKNYPNAHLRKAQLFEEKGDLENFKLAIDGAIKASKAKKDDKSEEAATQLAGNLYLKSGAEAFTSKKYNDAVKYFNLYLEYKAPDSDVYFQLAATYNNLSQWDNAIEAANKALELFTEKGTTKDARIYFELGNAYVGKNDTTSACDAYSKAKKGDYVDLATYKIETELKCK